MAMPQTARLREESVEAIDVNDELFLVLRAVSGLSVECKRVLTLRKVYGWEHDRIAAHLGIEKNAVENDLRVCVQTIARYSEHL
jgi:DNA-directed RNA polymerase specialized sigma24 family protein